MSVYTFTLTPNAPADSFMDATSNVGNYGDNLYWRLGMYAKGSGSGAVRPILSFDITAIGAATVTATQLDFYAYAGTSLSAEAATLYRIRRTDWVERLDVTWNNYKSGTAWTAGGASDSTNDYSTTNSVAFTTPSAIGAWSISTGTNLVALVQDAIDNRSGVFHFMMRLDTEDTAGGAHYSENYSREKDNGLTPKLTITYTGGIIPRFPPSLNINQAVNRGGTY